MRPLSGMWSNWSAHSNRASGTLLPSSSPAVSKTAKGTIRNTWDKLFLIEREICLDIQVSHNRVGESCKKNQRDVQFIFIYIVKRGPGSSVGIATAYGLDGPGIESRWGEIFRTSPDRPWGPPSLLYNGYRVLPGGKVRPGRDADPSPPSSAEV